MFMIKMIRDVVNNKKDEQEFSAFHINLNYQMSNSGSTHLFFYLSHGLDCNAHQIHLLQLNMEGRGGQ